jgi:diguanylate cyclase (GGDEF)-like protein
VRLGGDEFAVLLPRVENHEAVLLAAELKESLSGIDFADEGAPDLQLSAAVGVAELGPQDETIDDLLARADQAMYRDKAAHKNAG